MINIKQLKVDVLEDQNTALQSKIKSKLGINSTDIISFKIKKQSLDARDKNNIYYVYEVDVVALNETEILRRKHGDKNINESHTKTYTFPKKDDCHIKPVIVGSGPAGLFCALALAENGYHPIVIERGEGIEERVKSVAKFWNTGILNEESNVQFGEGGAGTFSDGKLNTLVHDHDKRDEYVLNSFVKFGAPEDILYSYKPHIGTDILRDVIKNMRNYIQSLGGEFVFNTRLTDIKVVNNKLSAIELNGTKWKDCDLLILAIGHSARDTFSMLKERGLKVIAKPFAVGFRIEHLQENINKSQYGPKYWDKLGAANYKLTYQSSNGHGVYSFCMCPGGYVVNASSEQGLLVVNGMSNHLRDSKNANSAIVVTVPPKMFDDDPMKGIEFQRMLERSAFNIGKGDIPIQLLGDFLNGVPSEKLGSIIPETKGKYILGDLSKLLPEELSIAFKEGIQHFDKKIAGFSDYDAIISGVESRTSSPLRILRDETMQSNIKGIFPCGEGAGYSGGIMTSAMDGIKAAEAVVNQ